MKRYSCLSYYLLIILIFQSKDKAVGLLRALTVPVCVMHALALFIVYLMQGVVEFAVSLFFAKMVAYTFLFWLPYYVAYNRKFMLSSVAHLFGRYWWTVYW